MWARGVQGEFSPQLVNLHLIIHKTETSVFAYNGDSERGKNYQLGRRLAMKSTSLCMHEKKGNIKEYNRNTQHFVYLEPKNCVTIPACNVETMSLQ